MTSSSRTDTDSSGHRYVEVPCNHLDEHLRVTAIPHTYGDPSAPPALRIQLRDATGRLRNGPEFSHEYLLDVLWALTEIARDLHPHPPKPPDTP